MSLYHQVNNILLTTVVLSHIIIYEILRGVTHIICDTETDYILIVIDIQCNTNFNIIHTFNLCENNYL